MKVNVVLRTCDRVSLATDRIVPKDDCIVRCLHSLVSSLDEYGNYSLHIVDDNSSEQTKNKIRSIAHSSTFNFLPERNQDGLNGKQKSRYSVKVAYDYIDTLPENELVYIVEDDYLHYNYSIQRMIDAWKFFSNFDLSADIGIFPQDFTQLYLHPKNPFNETYVRPCIVAAGPDRYYRTTWFTHESFMVRKSVITKHKEEFDKLMEIGEIDGKWEGTCLSNVWTKPGVVMLMPMKTLAIHVSKQEDISFYCEDFYRLWEQNAY